MSSYKQFLSYVQLVNEDANVLALELKSRKGLLHLAFAPYTKDVKYYNPFSSVQHPLTDLVTNLLKIENLNPFLEDGDSAFRLLTNCKPHMYRCMLLLCMCKECETFVVLI